MHRLFTCLWPCSAQLNSEFPWLESPIPASECLFNQRARSFPTRKHRFSKRPSPAIGSIFHPSDRLMNAGGRLSFMGSPHGSSPAWDGVASITIKRPAARSGLSSAVIRFFDLIPAVHWGLNATIAGIALRAVGVPTASRLERARHGDLSFHWVDRIGCLTTRHAFSFSG